jgi:hypothetical protein
MHTYCGDAERPNVYSIVVGLGSISAWHDFWRLEANYSPSLFLHSPSLSLTMPDFSCHSTYHPVRGTNNQIHLYTRINDSAYFC